ncbi:AsmA family protein [Ferriphaselus sp. R-1]|uniref:AsmA family protein n=1 Tax=Ferriphaselus sp. R-1 TaxID=1485544 RepID=UPI0005536068|nr:AsmA family protein [Ferriphaselus sp. R-1]
MNKIVKYTLTGLGGTVLLAAGAATYLAATFDPNAYKAEIIKAVQDSKQRTLKLDGDIKLTFFPKLGASLGKVSLSEFQSPQTFAAVEDVHAALAFWPLLHGEAVVDAVSVSGLKATLIKRKDGSSNIDDLLGKSDAPASESKLKFDIAGVSIAKTELSYRDEASGAEYTVRDLELSTGRIANGVQSPVKLALHVQANQPKLDVKLQGKADLTLDMDKKLYRLVGLDLNASGSALDITELSLKASGDAGADLSAHAFDTGKLKVSLSGKQGGNQFEVELDAPKVAATGDQFTGEQLKLSAKLKGTNTVAATLTLPSIAGTAQAFGSKALTLAFDATGDALPGKHVSSEMRGSFAFDADKQSFEVALAGGLLQSQVKAKVALNDFAAPHIRFDVDVDQFDADLYFPPSDKPKAATPEQPFDLTVLRKLDLDGKLHIGALTVAKVKSRDINLTIKAHQGLLNVAPFSAKLYEGSISGSLAVNAAPATPGFAVNQNLTGINVAALTKDAAAFDTLEGHGNVGINVTTQGNTVSALKKSLNGSATLNLTDGAIKGINIAQKLRSAGSLVGQTQTQAANSAEKTDFSELKGSFRIAGGVAHNDDLSMKSPLLRLAGNGDIDLGNDSMNYLAKATLVKTLQGQGGQDNLSGLTVPVRVQGPFASLKYSLDFGAALSDSTRQRVEVKKQELKTRLQDQLKGLFR